MASGAVKVASHLYQDALVGRWNSSEAYRHTIVMGNEGRVINRLVTNGDAKSTVEDLAYSKPKEFFLAGAPPRLAIYAHGGLNNEDSSIKRIRTMAPYFKANGIYPLFLTWKTGFLDSFLNILEDSAARIFHRAEGLDDLLDEARRKAEDVLDRTIELACENLGVKAIWSQMKQNAKEAAKKGGGDRGGFLTTSTLKKLLLDFPDLEIHLMGHSAGSIILGHMLDDFPRNGLKVKTLNLFAPACSLDFANIHIQRAVDKKVLDKKDLHIHTLSSKREKDDVVGPYRKSLLYLVSRALEESHKTPLLGMEDIFHAENNNNCWKSNTLAHLKKWQKFYDPEEDYLYITKNEQVVTARQWSDGEIIDLARISSAHGSFDNDVDVIDTTLRRITQKQELDHKVENLRF